MALPPAPVRRLWPLLIVLTLVNLAAILLREKMEKGAEPMTQTQTTATTEGAENEICLEARNLSVRYGKVQGGQGYFAGGAGTAGDSVDWPIGLWQVYVFCGRLIG